MRFVKRMLAPQGRRRRRLEARSSLPFVAGTDPHAGFRRLTEAVDTTSPAGRKVMQILGCFAEFERSIVRAHALAGSTLLVLKAISATAGRS